MSLIDLFPSALAMAARGPAVQLAALWRAPLGSVLSGKRKGSASTWPGMPSVAEQAEPPSSFHRGNCPGAKQLVCERFRGWSYPVYRGICFLSFSLEETCQAAGNKSEN